MKNRLNIGLVFSYLLITAYTILSVYPFLWMLSASMKESVEVYTNNSLIPANPSFTTLIETWQNLDFPLHFANSLFLSTLVIIPIIMIYSLAGYAFALLPFRGSKFLFYFFLSLLLVPGITVLVPLYLMLRSQVPLIGPEASYLSTFVGLALPMINGGGPFAIFLFRNYFKTIPYELHDAAVIDGCTELRIFWNIYLPLAMPAVATIAIINFIGTWNAYAWPSIVINKKAWLTCR